MSDDLHDRRTMLATIALFFVIALLIAWDLIVDSGRGANWVHLGTELLVFLMAVGGIGFLWFQLKQTQTNLTKALVEAEQWRNESQELLRGLGIAIEKQFDRWRLTKAEAEIGLMLLKGLSHKEIAGLRQTSERTTREQARALYRKSGLSGRSSLSSFFLEDLLLPPGGKDR